MATFTITTPQNITALAGKTGGDVYNINGGSLTIDTDSRYGLNQSTSASLANITISATLGGTLDVDARFVRIIPYNTGAGNVPAVDTVITQGSASGRLIGVYSAVNVAPTAAGAAMPASGFVKIRQWNSIAFAAGALTGIGATATAVDTPGWIELIGDEAATCTVPRLGTARFRGEWYEVGNTNGTANQQFQLPTNGSTQYFPGIFIEKTVGSNDYEFYPNSASQTTVATDIRAKVCWISTAGLLRIGHNGTANAGFVPVTGLKVRIPNILCQNCTTAARTTNALPNATLATRYDFTTSGGGVIEFDKTSMAWYPSFTQAFAVSLTNFATVEQISVSEIASPMIWSKVGVGQSAAQSQFALLMTLNFAGGTFTDCHWSRATLAASGQYTCSLTDCSGFTFENDRATALLLKGNATSGNWACTRVVNSTWNSPKLTNGRMVFATCKNISVTNTSYADVITGTTNTTAAQNSYVFELSSACDAITISGFDHFGLTNVQAYLGVLSIAAAGCTNIKLRNIGTRAAPRDLGATNGGAFLFVLGTGAAASDVKVQRCYVSNTRSGLWSGDNSSTRITFENVAGDFADAPATPMLNCLAKGVGCTHAVTAQTACYGTHFVDMFTSATVGRILLLCNEKTSLEPSASTYSVLAGNPAFTSAGGLYMPVIGDSIEFTMPYFALGHTSFQNSAAVMGGGTIGNYTLQYQLDKNDGNGFGTLKTLSGANLSSETGINPALGVKLKIRITTSTTNATAITSLYVLTNSTAVAQDNQYPLDVANVTVSGLVQNSRVKATKVSNGDVLFNGSESSGSVSFTTDFIGAVKIEARKASAAPFYIPWETQITTISNAAVEAVALQVLDE